MVRPRTPVPSAASRLHTQWQVERADERRIERHRSGQRIVQRHAGGEDRLAGRVRANGELRNRSEEP